VRYLLLPLLLTLKRDDEVEPLLLEYDGDLQAVWRFGQALWLFRREGDSPVARAALAAAVAGNEFVVGGLLEPESLPEDHSPYIAFGSPEEASACVDALDQAWHETPGALKWLRSRAPRSGGRAAGRRGKRRRRR
jgi:hypothetical protein